MRLRFRRVLWIYQIDDKLFKALDIAPRQVAPLRAIGHGVLRHRRFNGRNNSFSLDILQDLLELRSIRVRRRSKAIANVFRGDKHGRARKETDHHKERRVSHT